MAEYIRISALLILALGLPLVLYVYFYNVEDASDRYIALILLPLILISIIPYMAANYSPYLHLSSFIALPAGFSIGPTSIILTKKYVNHGKGSYWKQVLLLFLPVAFMTLFHYYQTEKIPELKDVTVIINQSSVTVRNYTSALLLIMSLYTLLSVFQAKRMILSYFKENNTVFHAKFNDSKQQIDDSLSLYIFNQILSGILYMVSFLLLTIMVLYFFDKIKVHYYFIPTFLLTFLLYTVVFRLLSYREIPNNKRTSSAERDGKSDSGDDSKYENQRNDEVERRRNLKIIQEYMQNKKPWKDFYFSIQQLANDVKLPVHHISMAINSELKMNFFQFVNEYRLQAAENLLQDAQFKEFSIIRIAFEAGFQSKATFNRCFKAKHNLTPKEFRNKKSA